MLAMPDGTPCFTKSKGVKPEPLKLRINFPKAQIRVNLFLFNPPPERSSNILLQSFSYQGSEQKSRSASRDQFPSGGSLASPSSSRMSSLSASPSRPI